jgi:hypothetical protein
VQSSRADAKIIAENIKECRQELLSLTAQCSQARANWPFPLT